MSEKVKYTYDDYAKETADRFIRMLQEGTTPYQKQWKGEDLTASIPRNGLTGVAYKGSNSGDLWMKQIDMGYKDPRWLTVVQAKKLGAYVNKGEKHTKIIHWNLGREIDKLDENGKPILDENGEKQTVYQKYAVPSMSVFQVFNAEQFTGIPPLTKEDLEPKRDFIPIEMGERILQNSGAIINFDERGRSAHYSPSKDEITLPSKELFVSEMAYYSTALHELGHWTGHDSRLNRDLSSPFGTDGYAKEELRAEIASFMLSCELGIDFDPTNHGAYVNSWCRNLTEEPKEIFKASADAVKIKNFVMELTLEKEVEKVQEVTKSKEDIVLQNRQEVGDYMKELQAQYPNFVVTYGMSLKTNSLYSDYIMADKDNKNIRTLNISPKGVQEWGTISPERAIERLENSYKAYLVKEWGLDKTMENETSLEQREIEKSMENHYVFPSNPINTLSPARFDVDALTKHFQNDPMTTPSMVIPKEAVEDAIKRYGTMEIKDDNGKMVELKINGFTYELSAENGLDGSIHPKDYMDNTPFENNVWVGATVAVLTPHYEREKDYHSDPLVAETKRLTDITHFDETNLSDRVAAARFGNFHIQPEAVEDALARYGTIRLDDKELDATYGEIKVGDELFIVHKAKDNAVVTPRESWNDTLFQDLETPHTILTILTPKEAQIDKLDQNMGEKIYPKIVNENAKYPNATILHVPYSEKNLAGSLGARWEQSEKTWVAPVGTDLEPLAAWLTAPQKEIKEVMSPQAEFAIALKDKGLILDGEPIMDGKLHRVAVEGDKGQTKSGAYTGHLDGRPAGFIQNFKEQISENWKAQSCSQENIVSLNPTPEQQAAQKVLNAEKEAQRQKEQLEKHNEVSVNVRTKLSEAREAGDNHPYLVAKGVQNHGLKLDDRNNLYMPLSDIDGKIWSAQSINNGFKGFEKGGKKEGNFFTIGEHHSTAKELLICEGYATGASIHEATGKGVIVAVDAGNLENVGLALRERYPDKIIAYMADDDIAKATDGKKNVGLFSAEAASELTKGVVIYPQLTASEIKDGKSDFNDIHKSRGIAELKAQLSIKMDKLFVKEDRVLPQKDKAAERGVER